MNNVFYKKIILLVFGFFLAFIVGEISLRLLNFKTSFYIYDSNTKLRTIIPNWLGDFKLECLINEINTNSYGFHDVEFLPKSPEVFRIVMIGDSFVEALHVPINKTFYKILEESLNKSFPHRKFEIFGLGISGNGSLMNGLYLSSYGNLIKPDLVINMFYDNNDFSDDLKLINSERDSLDYDIQRVNSEIKNPGFFRKAFNFISRNSVLVRVVGQKYQTIIFRISQAKINSVSGEQKTGSGIFKYAPNDYVYYLPDKKESWVLQKKLISNIKNNAITLGADFALVSFDTPDFQSLIESGVTDNYDPENKLSEISEELNIKYLPLEKKFKNKAIGRKINPLLKCDGHWSEIGHSWAAEEVYNWLIENKGLISR